jgi:hypothetical protein
MEQQEVVAVADNVFDDVVERLAKKGIDVYIDGPSIIYLHKKTGYKLVEFIDGLGPASERLALEADLKKALKDAQRFIQVPLNDNQLGAMASFIQHIGIDNFAKSKVLKALNEKKYEAVPKLMQNYRVGRMGKKHTRPKVRQDYIARRRYEAELFSTPGHLNWQVELDDVEETLYPAQRNLSFEELRAVLKLAKRRAYNKLGIFF